MKALAIVAALALSACAGNLQTRSTVSLAIACDTYASVLDQLTPMRREGKLSPEVVKRVSDANARVAPACDKGSVLDPAYAIDIVERAIALLKTVREGL